MSNDNKELLLRIDKLEMQVRFLTATVTELTANRLVNTQGVPVSEDGKPRRWPQDVHF